MQRPRDLGLSRVDSLVQSRLGPRSLDATLWWETIERSLSSDSTRFAAWEDGTGFDMEDELVETRLEAGRALGSWWNSFDKRWGGPEPWQVSLRMEGREEIFESCLPSRISGIGDCSVLYAGMWQWSQMASLSQLCHLFPVGPQASYFTSLCFSFAPGNEVTSQSCWRSQLIMLRPVPDT